MRKVATNIPEFTEWVEEIFAHSTDKHGIYEAPWFRGAGDARFKLIPGLYRTSAGKELFADDELRSEFMRKALPLVAGRTPRDEWEWYFLMQHHRAPTRLLDWTDAALVALYFALTAWQPPSSSKTKPSKPAVWALNPFALNRDRYDGPVNTDSAGFEKYLPVRYSNRRPPQHPLALDPSFISQRMLVQHSHFTIHGWDTRGLDEMRDELKLSNDLVKITIEADRDYLQQQLAVNGITETTIFPDLEGLARELRLEYGLDTSRPNMG